PNYQGANSQASHAETTGQAWELEVGSWKLTASASSQFPTTRRPTPKPHMPRRPRQAWELEVGSWKLTASASTQFPTTKGPTPKPHMPRRPGQAWELEVGSWN